MAPKQILVRGFVAGLVGATVLAAWFLIIDTIQGRPFATPAFLAGVLAGVDGADRSLTLITVYTLLHYAAFAVVGIAVAWLVATLDACPPIVLGLLLGFVLFDLVFYSGVTLTNVDVVDRLGWPQVLSGNLLAGVGLVAYLRKSLGATSPAWMAALTQHKIVRQGLTVGLVGAVTVAIWFFIIDLVQGRAFFTPGALGSAIFLRASDAAAVQVSLLTVAGYTVVHLAAFIAVGLAAAVIATQAERFPPLLLAGLLIFVTFEAFFLGMLAVAAEWLLGAIGWLSIGVGNLLATLVMAALLWRQNPKLRAALGPQAFDGEEGELSSTEADV
jgi:hypothetical protein